MGKASIRALTVADHSAALALWRATVGIAVGADDELPQFTRYLQRNPGLSMAALVEDRLVGAVLAGHDGRRGFLHHLAVATGFRGLGIGRALVAECLVQLGAIGIAKCHVLVFSSNADGRACWRNLGWQQRDELIDFSVATDRRPGLPA